MDTTPAQDAAPAIDEAVTASPVMTDAGVALHGDYPLNHRLRAEALAADGKEADPDGLIGDDLIAATKDRVAREQADADRIAAEYAAAHPPVTPTMKKDDLVEVAQAEGVPIDPAAPKAAIVDAIEASRLPNTEG